jgi:FtsH-binding integral membrane protein
MSWNQQQQPWISASTAEMDVRERSFIRSVYAWMFGGLLLTTVAALWVVVSPAMQQLVLANKFVFFGLLFGELGLVLFLQVRITRMSAAAAAGSFLLYSILNGLTLSVVFFAYSRGSLVQAFVTAAGMFGAMSIYGTVTKRDLTSWGSFFMMGLFGIIICMIVNMFIHSTPLDMTISVLGVFIFLGLTAYDTQKIRAYANAGGGMSDNYAIIGALRLYLDFVNIFLFLLRLFGGRRR